MVGWRAYPERGDGDPAACRVHALDSRPLVGVCVIALHDVEACCVIQTTHRVHGTVEMRQRYTPPTHTHTDGQHLDIHTQTTLKRRHVPNYYYYYSNTHLTASFPGQPG